MTDADSPDVVIRTAPEETPETPDVHVEVEAPASTPDHTDHIIDHATRLENHEGRISDLEHRVLSLPADFYGAVQTQVQAALSEVQEQADHAAELAEEAVSEPEPEPEPEEDDEEPDREHWFTRPLGKH